MKAMPLSGGIWEKNCSNALNPPAEAPIPTMGRFFGSFSRAEVEVLTREDFRVFFALTVGCFFFVVIT
jgi:hypothetical protein